MIKNKRLLLIAKALSMIEGIFFILTRMGSS